MDNLQIIMIQADETEVQKEAQQKFALELHALQNTRHGFVA